MQCPISGLLIEMDFFIGDSIVQCRQILRQIPSEAKVQKVSKELQGGVVHGLNSKFCHKFMVNL